MLLSLFLCRLEGHLWRCTPQHNGFRYRWARNHAEWTPQDWRRVLLTVETGSLCILMTGDKPVISNASNSCVPHVQQGVGGVMSWDDIAWGHLIPLVVVEGNLTAPRYRDEILQLIVIPQRQHFGDNFILMVDYLRVCRSVLVNTFIQRAWMTRMEWPASSPDMNPIEHVWDRLKRVIFGRRQGPRTLARLTQNRHWSVGQLEPGLTWASNRWYATTDSRLRPSKGTFHHVLTLLMSAVKPPPHGKQTILSLHKCFLWSGSIANKYV